jgi:hypothetical protein
MPEDRSGQRPVLPTFPEDDLPSAAQPGLLISVKLNNGDFVLAMSDDSGNWMSFGTGTQIN